MKLELPLAPTVNSYQPHANRGGRCVRYLSKDAKSFISDVMAIVTTAKRDFGRYSSLSVEIVIYPRDRRRQDIDNRIKPTLDALEKAGVYEDDSQVVELIVRRGEIRKGGMMEVVISEL